jgi:hypothetical protein
MPQVMPRKVSNPSHPDSVFEPVLGVTQPLISVLVNEYKVASCWARKQFLEGSNRDVVRRDMAHLTVFTGRNSQDPRSKLT